MAGAWPCMIRECVQVEASITAEVGCEGSEGTREIAVSFLGAQWWESQQWRDTDGRGGFSRVCDAGIPPVWPRPCWSLLKSVLPTGEGDVLTHGVPLQAACFQSQQQNVMFCGEVTCLTPPCSGTTIPLSGGLWSSSHPNFSFLSCACPSTKSHDHTVPGAVSSAFFFSERTKLRECEYPLIARILHGPCEKIAKLFLMEADLGEEVPHDVSRGQETPW